MNNIIRCSRSGVPLFEVETLCSNGWALLSYPHFHTFVHPVYNLPLEKLVKKIALQLLEAEANNWLLTDSSIREIGLSMSAIMYNLGSMWQPNEDAITHGRLIEASLPDQTTTVGCAARLLELASWYHNETSKRIAFPLWKPSRGAGNLNWHGFSNWLNACVDIKEEWGTQKRRKEDKALLDSTSEALKTVHLASVYKRLDISKVWNWIALQTKEQRVKYPSGRQETLKELFLHGDAEPEAWLPDDCDDLIEMVTDCCDIGNDIMFFIRQRTSSIRASINDFYGNFTLISVRKVDSDGGLALTSNEQVAQDSLMGEYAGKLQGLTEAPLEPQLVDYPTRVHWLRAQAEWRILTKLFKERATHTTTQTTTANLRRQGEQDAI
jgi:hypothetical protein